MYTELFTFTEIISPAPSRSLIMLLIWLIGIDNLAPRSLMDVLPLPFSKRLAISSIISIPCAIWLSPLSGLPMTAFLSGLN